MSLCFARWRPLLAGLACVITAVGVAGMAGLYHPRFIPELYFTGTVSAGFVLVAVVAGGFRSRYGLLIIAALIGCWFGDVLGQSAFLNGTGAFLTAHLFFLAAFVCLKWQARRAAIALPIMTLAAALVMRWLWPHLPVGHGPAIAAYAVVLASVVVFAAGASAANAWVLPAAIIFFISDLFVARWRYVSHTHDHALFCYPLYYAACLLFALSVFQAPKKSGDTLSES